LHIRTHTKAANIAELSSFYLTLFITRCVLKGDVSV